VSESEQTVLVWRHNGASVIRALTADESAIWGELEKGVPVGEILQRTGGINGVASGVSAADCIQSWLEGGLLSSSNSDNEK